MSSNDIFFTIFTSDNCKLTKKHSLGQHGKLHTIPSAHMSSGHAETVSTTFDNLPKIIGKLEQNQCLGLGVWADGLLEDRLEVDIVTAGNESDDKISRTLRHFQFMEGQPALMYIDVDGTDLSMDQAHDLLLSVDPELEKAEMVVTYSSSSHIYRADGTPVREGGSMHFFFVVSDGSLMKEYGQILFNRLILTGHGKTLVDKSGKVWVKTMIDSSVWSPEREVFEATPVCEDGLVSKKNDFIHYQDGEMIDVESRLLALRLNKSEELQLKLATADLKNAVAQEAKETLESHRLKLAKDRAEKNKSTIKEELRVLYSRSTSVDKDNRPIITVPASDWIMQEDGTEIQVSEILIDPDSWNGVTLPDIDEPFYGGDKRSNTPGKQKAKIFVNYDASGGRDVVVNSNAHGGILYKLTWDFKQLLAHMTKASEEELAEIWSDFEDGHMSELVLSAGELDDLAKIFKSKLGDVAGAGVSSTKSEVVKDLKRTTKSKKEQQHDDGKTTIEEELWKLNKKYAVVGVGHTCRIFTEVYKPALGKWEAVPKDKTALGQLYANKLVPVQKGNTITEVSLFDLWMEWEHRNTFHYADMMPNATRFRGCGKTAVLQQQEKEFDTFNTWQGYLCNFKNATSCELIKTHIYEVWCSKNQEAYDYVIKWMAHLFQKPAERCQTALVFKSTQGAGKNMIIDDVLGKLLGVHYVMTSKSALVTGRFNSLIANSVLVFMNEALWSGDKAASGVVKSQTTDSEIVIERKGIEGEAMRNFARYIYSSNNDWVTGVEYRDRRFFYAPTSDHRVGDRAYFATLLKEIKMGGKEAFLQYLLGIDITDFNTAEMPSVSGQQKFMDMIQTESPILGYMYCLFQHPDKIMADVPNLEEWLGGNMFVLPENLWEAFKKYCEDSQIKRSWLSESMFHKVLSEFSMISHDNEFDGCIGRTIKTKDGKILVELPPLKECRTKYEDLVSCEVPW